MIARFGDADAGGFFYTPHDHEPLISRNKDLHDNATPSGNATAAGALLRLGQLCGRSDLEDFAQCTLNLLSGEMARVSMAAGQALIVLDAFVGPAYELVIAEGSSGDESEQVVRVIQDRFLPATVIARRPGVAVIPTCRSRCGHSCKESSRSKATATLYVCRRGTCQAPVAGLPGRSRHYCRISENSRPERRFVASIRVKGRV